MNSYRLYDLHILLTKIYDYELNLFDRIKSQIFYKFKDNEEIRTAVKLWNYNNNGKNDYSTLHCILSEKQNWNDNN